MKSHPVPKVGDTVCLNACGVETIYGTSIGHEHMRVITMKITKVDTVSITEPEKTFMVEVDSSIINQFMINHWCFDIVQSAEDAANYTAATSLSAVEDIALRDSHGVSVERGSDWGSF